MKYTQRRNHLFAVMSKLIKCTYKKQLVYKNNSYILINTSVNKPACSSKADTEFSEYNISDKSDPFSCITCIMVQHKIKQAVADGEQPLQWWCIMYIHTSIAAWSLLKLSPQWYLRFLATPVIIFIYCMQLAGLRNNLREMMLKLPLVSTPPCLACLCMSSHSSEADDACYWLKCVMNSMHMTWHNI